MFRIQPLLAAIALLLLAPAAAANANAPGITPEMSEAWNAAEINWRDIKSGIREAATTKKTAIMVFHAPWCTACKKYRAVFKDKDIVEASKDFIMILIDGDADKIANGAFAPDGTYVPRTLFLNPDGDVLTGLVGKDPKYPHTIDIENPDELLTLMRKAKAAAPPASAPVGEGRT
jgi:protein-disulfide reductase (glutathione)